MAALTTVLVFACISLHLIACRSDQQSPPDSLQMVQILFRHGDRSPIKSFPTNPLQESSWPQGFGQLTTRGMMQHYVLGQYLKERYIDGKPHRLISASYNRSEVRVRSTDVDRTLMSAYSNLAGLYPPSGAQLWNKDIAWQPIPVHTIPKSDDYLLSTDVPCKKYEKYVQAALNSDDIRKMEEENQEFYKLVGNKTGIPNMRIGDAGIAFDAIFCARQNGYLEPDWVNITWKGQTIFEKLQEIQSLRFDIDFNRPGESRFRGGPLLGEMIKNMKGRIDGSFVNRFLMYSAHDSTVCAFLSAMKVYNLVAPPYAATVLVELHEITSQSYIVRVFYKNDSNHEAYPLQIPGCVLDCPFEEFIRITEDNIPTNWHAECDNTLMPRTDGLILLATGIILMSVILVTILVYVLVRIQSRRQRYTTYEGLGQNSDGGF